MTGADAAGKPRVTVVGLGPGAPEHLGEQARRAIEQAQVAYLRTRRHPSAAAFSDLASFDHHYEEAPSFAEVYRRIVDDLVDAAAREAVAGRAVLYAVPGSPLVAEDTVARLRADGRVAVEVVPALSFLDLAWAVLAIDPVAEAVAVVDGTALEAGLAGRPGPFLVAQCWSQDVLSRLKLALDTDDAALPEVVVLQRLGMADQRITRVALADLDRVIEPDHLTSVFVPRLAAPVAPAMAELEELVRTLRERCPWDREQTHTSLTRHLIEESYEVLDAIAELTTAFDGEDDDRRVEAAAHLEEELGDLLFQVFFHARLAAEEGLFTLSDVATGVHNKLVGRHPHVFANVVAETPGAVVANWEAIKAAEKGRQSVTEGIPSSLPALLLASKLLRKGRAVGLEVDEPAVLSARLAEAVADLGEAPGEEAVGRLLLAAVAVATEHGVDAEDALRAAAHRERDRIVDHERAAGAVPGA